MRLADFLFQFKDRVHALSDCLAKKVVELWCQMDDYDKRAIAFTTAPRQMVNVGRFQSVKDSVSTTVEGVKRSFLGRGIPAGKPDANRYIEAVMVRLCDFHQNSVTLDGVRVTRWKLILGSYSNIAKTVKGNATVMENTAIQLVPLNIHTLNQWNRKRGKESQQQLLLQGLPKPVPPAVKEPVPIRPIRPAALSRKPTSTEYYRLAKEREEAEGLVRRKYVRQSSFYKCRKCEKDQSDSAHLRFRRYVYCVHTESRSFEEWKSELPLPKNNQYFL